MAQRDLSLQEQLLLLSLNDESGIFDTSCVQFAMSAAALAELVLSGRVELEGDHPVVKSTAPTGDAALDVALAHLRRAEAVKPLSWWMRYLYPNGTLPQEVCIARLVLEGVLDEKNERFLWVFPQLTNPTAAPEPEQHLREQLRRAAVEGDLDERTAILLGLFQAWGLRGYLPASQSCLLSEDEAKDCRERLERFFPGHSRAATLVKAFETVMIQENSRELGRNMTPFT